MMFSCRSYSGKQAAAMHLANFCFPDDRFEAELAALSADILSNSWYANRVNKRADRNRRTEPARCPRARVVQERGVGAGRGATDCEILYEARIGRQAIVIRGLAPLH